MVRPRYGPLALALGHFIALARFVELSVCVRKKSADLPVVNELKMVITTEFVNIAIFCTFVTPIYATLSDMQFLYMFTVE